MEKETNKLTNIDLFSVSGGGGQNAELDPSEVVAIKVETGKSEDGYAFKATGLGAGGDKRERELGTFHTLDEVNAFSARYLRKIAGKNFN